MNDSDMNASCDRQNVNDNAITQAQTQAIDGGNKRDSQPSHALRQYITAYNAQVSPAKWHTRA